MSVIIIGGGDHGNNHAVIDNAHTDIRRIAVALGRNKVTLDQGAAVNEVFATLRTLADQVDPK